MLRLIGIVMSIGLADSLNPTTIAPALYIAGGERPRQRVTAFTIGVFAVYFVGGAVIALGPGQLLLSLIPHPQRTVRHVIEVIAGAILLAAGTLLWRHRAQLAQRELPGAGRVEAGAEGRSSALLGATITAVELPTAFPYFGAIAAIVAAPVGVANQLLLLVLFNVCFVAPLAGIAGTLWFAGDGAAAVLDRGRAFLQRHWPGLLATAALVAGSFVILLGATGIAARVHGRVGGLARSVQHLLHLPK